MVFRFIVSCYFWISTYLCPSYISGIKHKNSNMSYKDDEDLMREIEASDYDDRYKYYMDNEEEQTKPLIRSSSEIFIKYKCGYCNRPINIPQYMYHDKVFCTTRCRSNLMIQEENYSIKGQSISFSL